jgi:hypothetical protein
VRRTAASHRTTTNLGYIADECLDWKEEIWKKVLEIGQRKWVRERKWSNTIEFYPYLIFYVKLILYLLCYQIKC